MKELNPTIHSIEEVLAAYRRYLLVTVNNYTTDEYEKEELIQSANIAIWKAYEKYDKTQGDFHSYALVYIKGAMMNWLTRNSRTVKPSARLVNEILSDETETFKKTISIDIQNEDGINLDETIGIEEEDNELDDQQEAIRSLLRQYLSQLKEQYQIILKLRYVEEKSINDIGIELGLTRQAVDQQLTKAISQLQKAFGVEQKRHKGVRVGYNKNKQIKKAP